MESQRSAPWHVCQANLTAYGVHLIARAARGTAGIVGDLPRVVSSQTAVELHAQILFERKVLAEAPVEREIVAGDKIEVFLLGVLFVSQRRDDGSRLVVHWIPC